MDASTGPATGSTPRNPSAPRTGSTPRAGASLPTGPTPHTGAQAVVANAIDPARRPDVLFRVRREAGETMSPWWMIGAFVVVSGVVIVLMSFVPGGA